MAWETTEDVLARRKLRESEAKLALLIDQVPEPNIIPNLRKQLLGSGSKLG